MLTVYKVKTFGKMFNDEQANALKDKEVREAIQSTLIEDQNLIEYLDPPFDDLVQHMEITKLQTNGTAVWEIKTARALKQKELRDLLDYIEGQCSDGWGEGFEQQDIEVDDVAYSYSPWKDKKSPPLVTRIYRERESL
jgi:hypothetical protein